MYSINMFFLEENNISGEVYKKNIDTFLYEQLIFLKTNMFVECVFCCIWQMKNKNQFQQEEYKATNKKTLQASTSQLKGNMCAFSNVVNIDFMYSINFVLNNTETKNNIRFLFLYKYVQKIIG